MPPFCGRPWDIPLFFAERFGHLKRSLPPGAYVSAEPPPNPLAPLRPTSVAWSPFACCWKRDVKDMERIWRMWSVNNITDKDQEVQLLYQYGSMSDKFWQTHSSCHSFSIFLGLWVTIWILNLQPRHPRASIACASCARNRCASPWHDESLGVLRPFLTSKT